jgi:hypothetical protein
VVESVETVRGGCLCGQVRFEVEPDYIVYRYCFCSRCRKVRGTAHAANVFVKPERFQWTAGGAGINRFDLPGARFGNCFCTNCGSPVPRHSADGKSVLIPAGAFDEDPGTRPDAAIFWDSRGHWLPVADEIEKHAEYK